MGGTPGPNDTGLARDSSPSDPDDGRPAVDAGVEGGDVGALPGMAVWDQFNWDSAAWVE